MDEQIKQWRQSLADLSLTQADELEDHLRQQHAELVQLGLDEHEAFAVAAMRCGRPSELVDEFVRANPTTMWVQRLRWAVIGCLVVMLGLPLANAVSNAAALIAMTLGFSTALGITFVVFVYTTMTIGVLGTAALFATKKRRLPVIRSLRLRRYMGYALLISGGMLGVSLMYLGPSFPPSLVRIRPPVIGVSFVAIVALLLSGLWQLRLSRGASPVGLFRGVVCFITWIAVASGLFLVSQLSHLFVIQYMPIRTSYDIPLTVSYASMIRSILLPAVLIVAAMWAGHRAKHSVA